MERQHRRIESAMPEVHERWIILQHEPIETIDQGQPRSRSSMTPRC